MSAPRSLLDWVNHLFNHPVANPPWHAAPDAPFWEASCEQLNELIAHTFQHSGALLVRFSDAQLNQAFWYLVGESGHMLCLVDAKVPLYVRLRTLRAFVPLFEQVMAQRCSPHLGHLDEPGANPLNSACYMWWDSLPIYGCPELPERAAFDREVQAVFGQLLAIPHDACRESALHGIGHWVIAYPRLAEVALEFVRQNVGLRPELAAYARAASHGCVL
jgi:hypothetical protein